jgi:hypothetical protein
MFAFVMIVSLIYKDMIIFLFIMNTNPLIIHYK